MRKFFILIIATVFVFASCSFTTPKAISVKTKASYELTVMKIDEKSSINKDLVESFDTNSLFDISDNELIKAYDYWPDQDDKIKKFLISVNVAKIPFDLSSYFEDLDIAKDVSNMSFEKEIEIPEFKETEIDESISMNSITEELNSMVKFGGLWNSSVPSATLSCEMEGSKDFESISYEAGQLYVFVKSDRMPNNITLTHNYETIAESNYFRDYYLCDYPPETSLLGGEEPDYFCVLEIKNKSVYKDMEIFISGGGVSSYYGEMRNGKIAEATGVSTDGIEVSFENGIEVETALDDDDSFADCVIEKGELALSFAMPESWTGVNASWDSISISGGLQISEDKFTKGDECVADLNDAVFKNENTIVDPKVSLTATDATFVFADNPSVKGHFSVEEIKSITVKLPEDTETKVETSVSLADSIGDTISKIVFGDSKISGTYYNTLPEGNDFELSCVSNLLEIDDSALLSANPSYTADNPQEIEISAKNGANGKSIDNPFPDIDFVSKFNFGAEEGYIKVKNVASGGKYKIGVNVVVEINWIKMTVNSLNDIELKNDDIDTGFELSSVFDTISSLGNESDTLFNALSFDEIPLYVYCQVPKFLGDDVKLKGNLIFGKMNDGEFIPSMNDKGEVETLFDDKIDVCPVPKLKFTNDPENGEFVSESIEKSYSAEKDLSKILSSGKGTLAFRCDDLKFSSNFDGKEITKAEIDAMKENDDEVNIELTAYVIVPLEFKVGKDGDDIDKIYTLSLIGEEGSRTEDENNSNSDSEDDDSYTDDSQSRQSDGDDKKNFLGVLNEVAIAFEPSNVPFKYTESQSAELQTLGVCIDFVSSKEHSAKDYLTFDGKYHTILDEDTVSTIINSDDLNPSMILGFPKGTFHICRDVRFLTKVNLRIKTDGTIPLKKPEGGR